MKHPISDERGEATNRYSLDVAVCCFLFLLTRAILMTSPQSKPLNVTTLQPCTLGCTHPHTHPHTHTNTHASASYFPFFQIALVSTFLLYADVREQYNIRPDDIHFFHTKAAPKDWRILDVSHREWATCTGGSFWASWLWVLAHGSKP